MTVRTDGTRDTARSAAAEVSADGVRAYLNRIGRIPLLTAMEEVELGARIEAGVLAGERLDGLVADGRDEALGRDLVRLVRDGARAREGLIAANLRLVVSIARRHTGAGVSLLDLIQEGNLGLMRAVDKFDHTRGYKFSTYATWWIRQAIGRARAQQSRVIRLPAHRAELLDRVVRTRSRLTQVLDREPTAVEIGGQLDLAADVVEQLLDHARTPLSLDQPVDEEGSTAFGELLADPHAADPHALALTGCCRREVADVLATLSGRESSIVRLRFGFVDGRPHTLEEIARLYGVTPERIRQIEARTMTKLRHPARSRPLRDFAD